jgi:glycosyltransferase involved in cell wall biosynthesis
LKIHWLSPLLPAKTGVAHYSEHLLPRLAERAEVVVFTPHENLPLALESCVTVRPIGQEDRRFWRELHQADLTVCHLSRAAPFHGAIVEIARRHPSLVVLHKSRLFGLVTESVVGIRGQVDRFLELCDDEAGRPGRRVGQRWLRGENPLALEHELPFTALGIEDALGVVVHSPPARRDVELVAPPGLPLLELPLPWPADENAGAAEKTTSGPRRLIAFGHFGPERRLDLLLEAVAAWPGKSELRLDVFGELREPEKIVGLRDRLGLQPQVTFRGFVLEEELAAAQRHADLGIDLRASSLGGASLVRLEMWRRGLAVAGTPTEDGSDGGALLPVREGHERADFAAAFAALDDRRRLAELAERGRRIVAERHDPAAYAEAFLRFASVAAGQTRRCLEQRWQRRIHRLFPAGGKLAPAAAKVPAEILAAG